jgi:hypothetical protein
MGGPFTPLSSFSQIGISMESNTHMTRKVLLVAIAWLLLAGLYQSADAQRYGRGGRPGPWIYLGESNVDGNSDHDRIKVGRDDGRFRALQIRVERAPIEFDRVVVHYASGADDEVPIRSRIPAGGSTRPIDLRGGDRAIESVEIWYGKARPGSRRPKLRLYGR